MKKSLMIAVGLATVLGITSCSSDDSGVSKSTSAASESDSTSDDSGDVTVATADGGVVTIPDLSGVSLPASLGECSSYLQAFGTAVSGQQTADGQDLEELFGSLEGQVPDDLEDSVKVIAEGLGTLQELYAKYDYDYTKIAADPAFGTLFADAEFATASTKLNEWFTAGCPAG